MTGPLGPHGTASPRRPTEVRVAVIDQRERHVASRRRWDLRLLFLLACAGGAWGAPRVAWRLTSERPLPLAVVGGPAPAGLQWWLMHERLVPSPSDAGAGLAWVAGPATADEGSAVAMHRARGGAVLAELHALEASAPGTAALARTLGVRPAGWVGRWVGDLASTDEVPAWMRARWAARAGAPWAFTGAGLVLFGTTDARLAVLPAARFGGRPPVTLELDRADDPLVARVRAGTSHRGWIAGVAPADSGLVLASWALQADDEGRRALEAAGFPARTPAIVRHAGAPLAAYVAGDLGTLRREPAGQRTRGLDAWHAWRARGDDESALRDVAMPLWRAMTK